MSKSELEQQFADILHAQCRLHGFAMPDPIREFRFHPSRRWRFDFAWPILKVAVEIDGGTWMGGRHSRGGGQAKSHDKQNAAVCLGWKVLRFTNQHLRDPEAVFEKLMLVFGALDPDADHMDDLCDERGNL